MVKNMFKYKSKHFFKSKKQERKMKVQMEFYYDNIYENMNMKQNSN
jgi:hypothetical protein